jgi:hypothetical protein
MTPRQRWTLLATIIGSGSRVSWFGLRDDKAARPIDAADASVVTG